MCQRRLSLPLKFRLKGAVGAIQVIRVMAYGVNNKMTLDQQTRIEIVANLLDLCLSEVGDKSGLISDELSKMVSAGSENNPEGIVDEGIIQYIRSVEFVRQVL